MSNNPTWLGCVKQHRSLQSSLSLFAIFFIFSSSFTILSTAAHRATAHQAKHRHLLHYLNELGNHGESIVFDPSISFENPCLCITYVALPTLKKAISSEPSNFTINWVGPFICNYSCVFCSPDPDNPSIRTIAGIDFNHNDISEYLALFHIDSNHFYGRELQKLRNLKELFELDLSNNRLAGKFPRIILELSVLK